MNNIETYSLAKKFLGQGGSIFRKFCGLPSGAAWCNAFVSYIFSKSGNASLYYGGKKVTYCPTSIKWCRKNLAQIPLYIALPMDVIYFDWEPNGIPNHIGFVKERKSADAIYTIEGNTSGGIVAHKTRTAKYVEAVFRPHYKPTSFSKTNALVIDGYFGYNSIAMLQKALGLKQDAILGKATVMALQAKAGADPDGSWGPKTTKALQKMLKVTVDGSWGPESTKALQRWINKKNGASDKQPSETDIPTTPTPQEKMIEWATKQTKKGYRYVNWNGSAKAKECPICKDHPKGKYYGWNCIGFVSACLHHGLGLKAIKCANNGFLGGNDNYTYLLKNSSEKAQKFVTDKVGKDFKVIKDGTPKKGDIVIYYKNNEFWHIALYVGGGYIIDSSSSTNGVTKRSWKLAYPCKVLIRYTGK